MDAAGLDELLAELRAVGGDHRSVEAKRAQRALPETTYETLSAFANTDGGLLLLGVDEAAGAFNVTGVADGARMMSDLQSQCAAMEPPLRAVIDAITHPDGLVIAAQIPAVPRNERPCHKGPGGPENSSFVRVGDGDQRLTGPEVAAMLANRSTHDFSASPAPAGAAVNQKAADEFARSMRVTNDRYRDLDGPHILRQLGVLTDGQLTLAGMLLLGDNPQAMTPAARVTYRRLPRRTDPPGARYSGRHLEGTVGELLDDTVAIVAKDLSAIQVARGGALFDELDVPREALREIVSNALIHRSFAPGQLDKSVLVVVSEESVEVTSPGSLHFLEDPATLGLVPVSGVRNYAMVRIGEQLRTPSGARIVEHQTSGIAAADRLCHEAGTMPALFVDGPATFQVIMLRGRIDTSSALSRLAAASVAERAEWVRLVSVLEHLETTRALLPAGGLSDTVFDARFAARALAPCSTEDAAAELRALEDAGVLRRVSVRRAPSWALPAAEARTAVAGSGPVERHGPRERRQNRIPTLLAAIDASARRSLTAGEIGVALGLSSTSSRRNWIVRALDEGLIVSDAQSLFDSNARYSLTAAGQAHLAATAP